MSQLSTLGQLTLVLLAYVIFCFCVWKKIWFDPFGGKSSYNFVNPCFNYACSLRFTEFSRTANR